ncbi:MAG: tetratricopeptide repeat protein [Bacteroidia bacterium]|nr:tetratricopeptide repeat protein [Bacteroidia bacterium]
MQKYLSPVIRFLFCVFIILKAPYCFPQSIIDSLEQALTEQPESDKPGTLILLSEEYRKTDVRKSIKTASIALSLARKLELRKEEASALNEIGRSLNRQSDYKKAIEYFEKSLEIRQILLAENPDDHEIKSKISKSLNNIGNAYYSLGDFKNAADYLEKSAAVKKECNDEKGAAITLLGLGNIYNRWGQYKKAVENYQEAQNFFE